MTEYQIATNEHKIFLQHSPRNVMHRYTLITALTNDS